MRTGRRRPGRRPARPSTARSAASRLGASAGGGSARRSSRSPSSRAGPGQTASGRSGKSDRERVSIGLGHRVDFCSLPWRGHSGGVRRDVTGCAAGQAIRLPETGDAGSGSRNEEKGPDGALFPYSSPCRTGRLSYCAGRYGLCPDASTGNLAHLQKVEITDKKGRAKGRGQSDREEVRQARASPPGPDRIETGRYWLRLYCRPRQVVE